MIFDRLFSASAPVPNRGWLDQAGTSGSGWVETSSGERVDEITAMNLSGVWLCLQIIGNDISGMPWGVYEKQGKTRISRNDLDLDLLIGLQVSPEMDSPSFRLAMQNHALLAGNGYAEIERNYFGDPVALWLLDPFKTKSTRDSLKNLVYEVRESNGGVRILKPENVFHIKGLTLDGINGISAIQKGRETIGGGFALEKAGNAFFKNGFRPSGTVSKDGVLTDIAFKRFKDSLYESYAGAGNTGKPIILEDGAKWTALSISPNDAQYLGSREFSLAEIARWFNVKPYKLGLMDRETHTNIFQNALEHLQHTVHPWILRWETEARIKLFSKEERKTLYTKFDYKSLLRTDPASRSAYYKDMSSLGALDIDDILALEDMNPLENGMGTTRLVPMNMTTLERAISGENMKRPDNKTQQVAA
jgi:HK97 family phage portal protein